MKAYGGVDVQVRFLDLGISRRGGKPPGNQWIGGWVDPRAGLDDM
jgi:hypothetical protein